MKKRGPSVKKRGPSVKKSSPSVKKSNFSVKKRHFHSYAAPPTPPAAFVKKIGTLVYQKVTYFASFHSVKFEREKKSFFDESTFSHAGRREKKSFFHVKKSIRQRKEVCCLIAPRPISSFRRRIVLRRRRRNRSRFCNG
jgi:hypothetical protein